MAYCVVVSCSSRYLVLCRMSRFLAYIMTLQCPSICDILKLPRTSWYLIRCGISYVVVSFVTFRIRRISYFLVSRTSWYLALLSNSHCTSWYLVFRNISYFVMSRRLYVMLRRGVPFCAVSRTSRYLELLGIYAYFAISEHMRHIKVRCIRSS